MGSVYPSYLNIKDFTPIIEGLEGLLNPCRLCPWKCGVDRSYGSLPGFGFRTRDSKTRNIRGKCEMGYLPRVASYNLHFGEEKPISGYRGSGTIFFSGCSLSCVFCQNYTISQYGYGDEVSIEELARYMLHLQHEGAHNINLVTPTHFVPQIVKALSIAVKRGLAIPIVYNSGGYDRVEVLKLLDGIVDIYLPDLKYSSDEVAKKYSGVKNYVSVSRAAIVEMFRQVGPLVTNNRGIAIRGVLVRHLVLPNDIAGTEEVLRFLRDLSPEIAVNVMSQYYPAYRAHLYPELNGKITNEEFGKAKALLRQFGFKRVWF